MHDKAEGKKCISERITIKKPDRFLVFSKWSFSRCGTKMSWLLFILTDRISKFYPNAKYPKCNLNYFSIIYPLHHSFLAFLMWKMNSLNSTTIINRQMPIKSIYMHLWKLSQKKLTSLFKSELVSEQSGDLNPGILALVPKLLNLRSTVS